MSNGRLAFVVLVLSLATRAAADDFDRLEGRVLADLPGSDQAQAHESLSMEQIGTLPRIFRDIRSSILIVKSSDGNPARMLVSLGYRKPSNGESEPVPILVIERFDTFEAGPATTKLARGRDLMLFPGFRFDLDTGQVVPENQGADLQFVQDDRGQVQLNALKPSTIYTLSRSPLSEANEAGQPSRGRGVLPTDLSGRYRLVANGQWTGSLEIKADDQGVVQGRFRSDQTGSSYRVAGQVESGTRNMVRFSVVLPRARMEFDGWLWTEGKGAMAGSMTLLDRTYGFFALRENSDFAPEDVRTPIDNSSILVEPDLVVELRPDGTLALDGEELTRDKLLSRLQAERERRGDLTVLLQAPESSPYGQVADLLRSLEASGIRNLRLRVAPRGTEESP